MPRLVFLGKFGPLAPEALFEAAPPAAIVTLADLRNWVAGQSPALGAALDDGPFRVIVNHAIVHDMSACFGGDDEIAFLPPMSGG